jgi:hypothetical protein
VSLRLVKIMRGFREGARFDWLHPSNGPLPDFAAIYEGEEGQFEVLSWDVEYSWISMVCGPDWYHGGYPRSYRWWPDSPEPRTIWCRPTKGAIYDVEVKPKKDMLRQIAVASIHLHIMTEPWPEGWA